MFRPAFVEFQQRLVTFRAFAVGSAGQFHLDYPQIDAHLDFLLAVVAGDDAHLKLVRFELPAVQQRLNVLAQATVSPRPRVSLATANGGDSTGRAPKESG